MTEPMSEERLEHIRNWVCGPTMIHIKELIAEVDRLRAVEQRQAEQIERLKASAGDKLTIESSNPFLQGR